MSHIYTNGQFINFIERVFGEGKPDARNENIQVTCLFCKHFKKHEYNKKKLAVRLSNPHIVHCWVCGYRNKNLLDLLKKFNSSFIDEYKSSFLNAEDISQFETEDKNKSVFLPKGFELLVKSNNNYYSNSAKNYLKSRGISKIDDLWYWKIGITKETIENCRNRIIVPSYDEFGNLNYWTARIWQKNTFLQKYKNPDIEHYNVIFNENNINWDKELTLVEGVFDLFKCNQNATAVLGSELDINYKLFQNIIKYNTPVLLAFDNERAAQNKQNKIAKSLSEFNIKIRILQFPQRDMDVGELTKEKFLSLRENAKTFSDEFLLRQKINSIL